MAGMVNTLHVPNVPDRAPIVATGPQIPFVGFLQGGKATGQDKLPRGPQDARLRNWFRKIGQQLFQQGRRETGQQLECFVPQLFAAIPTVKPPPS